MARLLAVAVVAAVTLTGIGQVPAQAADTVNETGLSKVASRVTGILSGVVANQEGRVLWSTGPSSGMLPASTMKILTAVNAFEVLGQTGRLSTRMVVAGPGQVVLTGGADPLLSTRDIEILARKTHQWWTAAGGGPLSVYLDDTLLGDPKSAPGWVSGYIPTEVAPRHALARRGDHSWAAAKNSAQVLIRELRRLGTDAKLRGRLVAADGQYVVAQRWHTVKQAVAVMLAESDNSIAEALYQLVGVTVTGKTGWDQAQRAALGTLEKVSVDTQGARLSDGSGLSRSNKVPSTLLVDALTAMVSRPELAGLEELLPLAGKTGTLGPRYDRFTRGPAKCAAGRVHAKTGSLRDVISLAGTIDRDNGGKLTFAFVVNQAPARTHGMALRHALDELAAAAHGCLAVGAN